jgi:hypothetical protein
MNLAVAQLCSLQSTMIVMHNYIPWQHADLNIQKAFKHLSQYSQLEADWGLAALCLAP